MKNLIDPNLCKKCKLCIEICPCNIISNGSGNIHFIKDKEHICLKCGQCMAVCSSRAIMINSLDYEKDFFDKPENKVQFEEYYDFLATRRSVRNFKDEPVDDESIQKILDTINFAPYGSEPNKVHMTVVNNRAKLEEALPLMSKFLDDVVKWLENPFMRFMIKAKKGIETFNTLNHHLYPIAKSGNYKIEYGDRITRGAPAIIIFHADKGAEEHSHNSIIYAVYAILAAHSFGLGATMVGLVPAAINKVKEVRHMFQIPESHEAITSVIIGHQKIKYKRAIKRTKTNINWIN